MSKSRKSPAAVAPTRLALFGPPPLLVGEDSAAYDELLARISGTVKPADVLEEIAVRDVADLTWDISRWRRLKTNLLTANAHKGLKEILDTISSFQLSEGLSKRWAGRDSNAIEEVNKSLASAGFTMDTVMAETLSLKINDIERIDRMTMGAEARRHIVLRELDRKVTA